MNVYDFDGTIYKNDSTRDFYCYLLLHHFKVIKYIPATTIDAIKYIFGFTTKTKMKETFYHFLKCFKKGEIDYIVNDFWEKNEKKIYKWYYDVKEESDVVISASPQFLLEPICKKLKVNLICSKVNAESGDYIGINCYGEEKVRRFKEVYNDVIIENFYSDSKSDEPLARIAKNAYIVKKKGDIKKWAF